MHTWLSFKISKLARGRACIFVSLRCWEEIVALIAVIYTHQAHVPVQWGLLDTIEVHLGKQKYCLIHTRLSLFQCKLFHLA